MTNSDRNFYRTWKNDWNISDDLINYATTLANGKASPMTYLNQVLSNWHKQGVTTEEEAKRTVTSTSNGSAALVRRQYTPQELNSIFSDMDDYDNLEL